MEGSFNNDGLKRTHDAPFRLPYGQGEQKVWGYPTSLLQVGETPTPEGDGQFFRDCRISHQEGAGPLASEVRDALLRGVISGMERKGRSGTHLRRDADRIPPMFFFGYTSVRPSQSGCCVIIASVFDPRGRFRFLRGGAGSGRAKMCKTGFVTSGSRSRLTPQTSGPRMLPEPDPPRGNSFRLVTRKNVSEVGLSLAIARRIGKKGDRPARAPRGRNTRALGRP